MKQEEKRKLNQKKSKLIEKLNDLEIQRQVVSRRLSKINDIFVEDFFERAK